MLNHAAVYWRLMIMAARRSVATFCRHRSDLLIAFRLVRYQLLHMSNTPRCKKHFLAFVFITLAVSILLGQSNRGLPKFDIVPDELAMETKRALLDEISVIASGDERPPNIVLILADDLGYSDTAVYGSKTIPTPHIDALARNGTRFTNAYVTAATCSPSRAGLMSGRYQQRFGFEFNTSSAKITHEKGRGLRPSVVTMAEAVSYTHLTLPTTPYV